MTRKTIILRHDCDNGLDWKTSRFNRLGNRLILQHPWIHSFFKSYNRSVETMLELEKFYGAKSTYFFRTCTLPSRNLVKRILLSGSSIGYHCDRDFSFKVFKEDLDKLNNHICFKDNSVHIGFKVKGVCKHGLSEIRSGGEFNHVKLINYARDSGLKYCCDGGDVTSGQPLYPEIKNPLKLSHLDGNLTIFTNRSDLYRHSDEEVEKYIESHDYPLVLVHPEDLTLDGVTERFVRLLETYRCISVEEALENYERVS